MFAVITDDFTGASELAGIALEKGYRTVIETQSVYPANADVLVIATDMRSQDPQSAAVVSAKLTKQILKMQPEFIFKKVDSVMRGNIGPELEAQMRAENKPSALLVPANPSRQRTINGGVYYVGGTPVANSGFALNHEFSAASSRVVDILRTGGATRAICISADEPFAGAGVHVGNAVTDHDLEAWAARVDDNVVPAGAADFFAAVLDSRGQASSKNGKPRLEAFGARRLYLCGSNFPSSRDAVAEARSHSVAVSDMPDEIYYADKFDVGKVFDWANSLQAMVEDNGAVIVTANQVPGPDRPFRRRVITRSMAEVASRVVKAGLVDELFIEGGSTSQAVMSALNADSLYPSQSIAPGVTRMRVDAYPQLHITMKPGSYSWPACVWNFKS